MPRTALIAIALLGAFVLTMNQPATGAQRKPGHVVYRFADGPLLRVVAKAGARPVDVSAGLDAKYPGGGDNFINQSPDGRHLVIDSERFGCAGFACLAVVSSDLERGEAVLAGEAHPEGYSAVANGGKAVVYPQRVGDDRTDLFVTRKSGSSWSAPVNITKGLKALVHSHPAIARSGKTVVHDCGEANEPSSGVIAICESRLDGKGSKVLVKPSAGKKPAGEDGAASLHHPDYLADGSVVFEANWCCKGESVWWLPKGKKKPLVVTGATANNVAPCGLPDGRVASLDLTRAGGNGSHELMLTPVKKRKREFVLPRDTDVLDAGIGCGA